MRQYQDLLRAVMYGGEQHNDRTSVGTRSIFGAMAKYDLREGFPLLTTKQVPFRVLATELCWIMRGLTNNAWLLERNVKIWNEWSTPEKCSKFSRMEGDLGPTYGKQWRSFGLDGVDQLKKVCDLIKNQPNSRRIILTAWDPSEVELVELPPCIAMLHFKVIGGRLDLLFYQRSADMFLGVPFDIAEYALLLSLVAHTHGLMPGILTHQIGDAHIYNNHHDAVLELLRREPRRLPKLVLNNSLWMSGFDGLLRFEPSMAQIEGYDPHPKIPAPVAV